MRFIRFIVLLLGSSEDHSRFARFGNHDYVWFGLQSCVADLELVCLLEKVLLLLLIGSVPDAG